METIPVILEEGLDNFTWNENSILYSVSETSPCKEIYQAVCDEIGRFYQAKGFKYSPSGRKLEYQFSGFIFKISFASSHYNSPGDYVALEVNSGIYPEKLRAHYKAVKHRLYPIILSNVVLLDEALPDREPGTVQGVSMFGEVNEIKDERYQYAFRVYSRHQNVYGITLVQFRRLLEYVNRVISYSFSLVLNPEQLKQYIVNAHPGKIYWLKDERFVDYLHLYHAKDSEVYRAFLIKYKELEGKEFDALNYAQH